MCTWSKLAWAVVATVAAGAMTLHAVADGLPSGRFNIGVYCTATNTTAEHIRAMKECGIDFVAQMSMRATNRTAEQRPLLAREGIGEVVYRRFVDGLGRGVPVDEMLKRAEVYGKSIRSDYGEGKIPGFVAIEFGDEPSARVFKEIAQAIAEVKKSSRGLPLFLNLYPNYASVTENSADQTKGQLGVPSYQEYIDAYCREVPLDHICWDFYLCGLNPKYYLSKYYDNFRIVADACRRTGRKLYFIGQVNSRSPKYWVSERQLRFQAFTTLAFGGESIMWACWSGGWWANQVVDKQGKLTQQYEKLKKVNHELIAIATVYMRFRNVSTSFVGFPDGCDDLAGLPVKSEQSLDDGFVRGLCAEDGDRLVVGTMAPRTPADDGSRAYVVLAADYTADKNPKSRRVKFALQGGYSVKAMDGNGPVKIERGEDGLLSFPIESCGGVFLVCRPVQFERTVPGL